MIDYGRIYSTEKPEEWETDEYSIYHNMDIVERETEDGKEFEFTQHRYTKDEFIEVLKATNDSLEERLVDTQMALCEIYELL